MFYYTISTVASNDAFLLTCQKVEKNYQVHKQKLLVDVDGTCIQIYHAYGNEIRVLNDLEVDAVYVESDMELPEMME